jgi:hypothetical protein
MNAEPEDGEAFIAGLVEKGRKADLIAAIKEAFALMDEPALMLLRGLEASGVQDIPAWLRKHSIALPRGANRKADLLAAIAKVRQQGERLSQKEFYDRVRNLCPGGWTANGEPGKGFNDKTIYRAMQGTVLDI